MQKRPQPVANCWLQQQKPPATTTVYKKNIAMEIDIYDSFASLLFRWLFAALALTWRLSAGCWLLLVVCCLLASDVDCPTSNTFPVQWASPAVARCLHKLFKHPLSHHGTFISFPFLKSLSPHPSRRSNSFSCILKKKRQLTDIKFNLSPSQCIDLEPWRRSARKITYAFVCMYV